MGEEYDTGSIRVSIQGLRRRRGVEQPRGDSRLFLFKITQLQDKVRHVKEIKPISVVQNTSIILIGRLLRLDEMHLFPEIVTITTYQQQVYKRVIQRTRLESHIKKGIFLGSLGIGFGNLAATIENKAPACEEPKPSDVADFLVKAASTCCMRLLDRFCCICFIRTCTHVNNQCAIVLTQLGAALCCCECFNCCFELFA